MYHETRFYSGLQEVLDKIEYGLDPLPLVVEFYPTNLCNLACSFCFGAVRVNGNGANESLLMLKDYYRIFGELEEIGIDHISFSGGGEPFAYRGFISLLEKAISVGFTTRLVTNGTLINRKHWATLLQLRELRFSVNAFLPETYAKLKSTSVRNFSRVIDNVIGLTQMNLDGKRNTEIGVTFTLSESNFAETLPFVEFMIDDIGVNTVLIKTDIYEQNERFKDACKELAKKIEKYTAGISPVQKVHFRWPNDDYRSKSLPCFVPHFKVAIDPYGNLFSCCLGAQPGNQGGYFFGNLKRGTFKQVWEESEIIRRRLQERGAECRVCNYTDNKINKNIIQLALIE
ncbi:MAG: radical SAM/SPASM domain-containing protein [Ardenticatenaceae bacterium]|nr:radical SAM/SPASM domain-containing protein [Ardenticatenaceae bacterium]